MKLADEAMKARSDYAPSAGSDEVKDDVELLMLNIPSVFTVPLQKEIAKQAGREWTENTTPEESLKLLDDLDQKQFIEVLNYGFTEAVQYLHGTLTQRVEDFAKITQERNKNETQDLFIAKLIDKTYGIDDSDDDKYDNSLDAYLGDSKDKRITGYNMVKWRLRYKQDDNGVLDGRDLRIIEKELYNLGRVRTDANRALKGNKPDPDLQISESSRPRGNDNTKTDIDEETSTLTAVGNTENAAKSVTSRLTGGLDIHRVKKEFENLPKTVREQLDGQVIPLLDALDKVDKGAPLANEAGDIASCAKAIQTAEVLQKKQYIGLRKMLGTLALNAQKA